MPTPDLRNKDQPVGPLRDRLVIDTSGSDDYELESGFICQVAAAGTLVYRTLEGESDLTQTGLAIGDVINVAGIPVILRAIRGTGTTVDSIIIGRL